MKLRANLSTMVAAITLLFLLMTILSGCGRHNNAAEAIQPDVAVSPQISAVTVDTTEAQIEIDSHTGIELSDDQALSTIRNYCFISNPDLRDIISAEEYPVYWDISASDEHVIVVLFRSYTGAQNRYYIDRINGDTYVTEFIPGVSSEEKQTGERFNIKDYYSINDATGRSSFITGTWQTASIIFQENGEAYPEYDVCFTDSEVIYGHLKDGVFIVDHSDPVILIEESAPGVIRVQAETANGVQYTYQTSATDNNILEYFESWDESDFPETYRGGASLSRYS